MKDIVQKSRFKNDMKKASRHQSFNKTIYNDCMRKIQSGEKLNDKYYDHYIKSSGNKYYGLKCFHLAPNLAVIYGIEKDEITLHRIGSHSDIQLTN